MASQGRAVAHAEQQIPSGRSGATAPVLRVLAAPSGSAANFIGTHNYLFLVTGRIGAWVGGSTNPAIPSVVEFGTVAAGVFTRACLGASLDSGAVAYQDNGLAGQGRVGFPFVMVHKHAMSATPEDVEIRAHAGDASSAYVSDLAIWWWDTGVFPEQSSITNGNVTLPRYPTFTAADQITVTHTSGTERHLILYSVDMGFADPANAWHSRVNRGGGFATAFIGASNRHIGSSGVGTVVAPWRQSLGFFRVHEITSGTESFQVQVASSQSSTANPGQNLYRSAIASVKLADSEFQFNATVSGLYGVNSSPGTSSLTFQVAASNESFTGEDCYTAVASTHAAIGTSQRNKLRLNGLEIAGHQGLHVRCGDSTCTMPMIALASERLLGPFQHTLDQRGLRNPYETPQGSAQNGFDVTELAVPRNAIPAAPTPFTPGPEVALIPGREAPALSALTVLPIEPSFALPEQRQFATRRWEMDTMHVVAHAMFGSPRTAWDLTWENLSAADYATLIAFLEARGATAWKWRPLHESADQAFVRIGGIVADDQLAPAVYTVRCKALQLTWVGP